MDTALTFASDCPCKNAGSNLNKDGTSTVCCTGLSKKEDLVPPEQSKLEAGEELIFPSFLQLHEPTPKHIKGERVELHIPTTLHQFLELKSKNKHAVIVGGFFYMQKIACFFYLTFSLSKQYQSV